MSSMQVVLGRYLFNEYWMFSIKKRKAKASWLQSETNLWKTAYKNGIDGYMTNDEFQDFQNYMNNVQDGL